MCACCNISNFDKDPKTQVLPHGWHPLLKLPFLLSKERGKCEKRRLSQSRKSLSYDPLFLPLISLNLSIIQLPPYNWGGLVVS